MVENSGVLEEKDWLPEAGLRVPVESSLKTNTFFLNHCQLCSVPFTFPYKICGSCSTKRDWLCLQNCRDLYYPQQATGSASFQKLKAKKKKNSTSVATFPSPFPLPSPKRARTLLEEIGSQFCQ